MLKIIAFAFVLLTCLSQQVEAQPSRRAKQNQANQATGEPSPALTDNGRPQIDQTVKAESERYRQERDAKEDVFKADQAYQNGIIARAAILNYVVTTAYAVVAFFTLLAIRQQAKKAGEQVGKMQDTLEAIRDQGKTLRRQAIGTTSQARSTRDMLTETRNLVGHNKEIVEKMQGQLEAIKKQETHLLTQAEAAKEQSRITGDSLVISQKAWVGVHRVSMDRDKQVIFVEVGNVGHIPAYNIVANMEMIVMEDLSPADTLSALGGKARYSVLKQKNYGPTQLFPGGLPITEIVRLQDHLTPQQIDALTSEPKKAFLFLNGSILYRDGFEKLPIQQTHFFFRYHALEDFWAAESPEPWRILFEVLGARPATKEGDQTN